VEKFVSALVREREFSGGVAGCVFSGVSRLKVSARSGYNSRMKAGVVSVCRVKSCILDGARASSAPVECRK
jgi:hypothetical protein